MHTPAPYTLAQLNGFIALNNKTFLAHLDECEQCDYFYGGKCETMQQIELARLKFLKLQEAQQQRGAA